MQQGVAHEVGGYLIAKDNLIKKFLVAMRLGETPVPIPNTMVKTYTADGTALETVWESRWPPVFKGL